MSPVVSELDEIKTLPCGALIHLTSLAQHNKELLGTSGNSKKEKPWETCLYCLRTSQREQDCQTRQKPFAASGTPWVPLCPAFFSLLASF
jgi:hypothetical protein